MHDDDDQLMIRIQAGDHGAFETLVGRYQGPLVGFFLRSIRDQQFAEDLTQETLLRVFSQAWDYLPVGKFRGWMYRIARNLMIDNIRRQSHDALIHTVRGDDGEQDRLSRVAGDVLSPDRMADIREVARLVDVELTRLPEDQRLTFLLYHYSGLSLPEVADVMESNTSTTKSRLRLVREKLQERLREIGISGDEGDGDGGRES
ncbi:MAG: sigma-70 family RNA polymerase sigma factor [Planctomycetales bacterium]|nr:sigma-70 family RNA polymerase sigma factor [Planctomycetales bacterium]